VPRLDLPRLDYGLDDLADNGARVGGMAGVALSPGATARRNVACVDLSARALSRALLLRGLPDVAGSFAGALELGEAAPINTSAAWLNNMEAPNPRDLPAILNTTRGLLAAVGPRVLEAVRGLPIGRLVGAMAEGVSVVPVVGQIVGAFINVIAEILNAGDTPDRVVINEVLPPAPETRRDKANDALGLVRGGASFLNDIVRPPGAPNPAEIREFGSLQAGGGVFGYGSISYTGFDAGRLGRFFADGPAMGFVPGPNVTHVGFVASASGSYDVGTYWPTLTSACQSIWNACTNLTTPYLWRIQASNVRNQWTAYLQALRATLTVVRYGAGTASQVTPNLATTASGGRVIKDTHLAVRQRLAANMHQTLGVSPWSEADTERVRNPDAPIPDYGVETSHPVRAMDDLRARQLYAARNLVTVAYAYPNVGGDAELSALVEAGRRDALESPALVHVEPDLVPAGEYQDEVRRRVAAMKRIRFERPSPQVEGNASVWSLFRSAPAGAVAETPGRAKTTIRDGLGRDPDPIPELPPAKRFTLAGTSTTPPSTGKRSGGGLAVAGLAVAAGVGGLALARRKRA